MVGKKGTVGREDFQGTGKRQKCFSFGGEVWCVVLTHGEQFLLQLEGMLLHVK